MKSTAIKFILFLALLVGANQAKAQSFYYGVKGGMNISSVTKRTDSGAMFAGNFGGILGIQIYHTVAIQAEVLYSFQGYYADSNYDPITNKNYGGTKVSLDYVKVPIMTRIFLRSGVSLDGGLSFNFLTSARYGGDALYGAESMDVSVPIGCTFRFGRHFELNARYEISLIPVTSEAPGVNSNFSVNCAWRFW